MVAVRLAGETRMFENVNSIHQFVHYGYVIADRIKLPIRLKQDRQARRLTERRLSLSELIFEGVDRFTSACQDVLSSHAGDPMHVVPISGGMDSRAILGSLLGRIDPSRIHTVTFGTPGTWDFDIGRLVAKEAGVANREIDLTNVLWDTDKLVRFAGEFERPVVLFEAYLFHLMRMMFGRGCIYWSGFMGDPLSGSHLLDKDSTTWEQAKSRFIRRNSYSRSINLTPFGFDTEIDLPSTPFIEPHLLCYDEQLDYGIRQELYIKPIVLLKGYKYLTPFLHANWVSFMLSVPRQYRHRQNLYIKILKEAFPGLFSIPVKNNLGLPLGAKKWRKQARKLSLNARALAKHLFRSARYINPAINYIDFDHVLREREDLRSVVYENIQDLKRRRITDWIDIDAIWQRHQSGQVDHADALTLLASLEINLKAQEARWK